ncbi:gamma-glutamylcyclotransferase a [Sinocyclocheilus rhinocerous]|uniref:gamma-glutamylcyclotransferase a n=1 Tax=Sinocyclocheilus rhinocerous TaxID=307959 RepID=UPI0007B8FE76|nr:PREDICTED: gamma-glutamylcyclotransferase-like [Sinocyclocheilus rhinocerous]
MRIFSSRCLGHSFSKMSSSGFFMYFAFGSNLLKERLQLKNPSAVFHCVGRIQDYRLNFGLSGDCTDCAWHGGVATIQESEGDEVWGVVWRIDSQNLPSLDRQEQVHEGVYSPLEVKVETKEKPLLCRTYKMNNFRPCSPSPQYKKVVCLGAQQNGLPQNYIQKLLALETNNYSGTSILDQITDIQKLPA